MNERLRLANYKLRRLEEKKKWRELGLTRLMSTEDFNRLEKITREYSERVFIKVRENQREKFERLSQRHEEQAEKQRMSPTEGQTPEVDKSHWVINMSKHQLTDAEKSVLERGLNFSQCPKSLPRTGMIVGVEAALR